MEERRLIAQRRIFFSRAHADKPWRLIEKLVAVVELLFQPRNDVLAFSSARIRNVVGDLEEVDVGFSFISDPTAFFEFIQIRDRNQAEGRPWLEQIIGQQEALNVSASRVVSTEHFADTVIRLAVHQGIPLRLLHPQQDSAIKLWFKPDVLDVGVHPPLFEVRQCSLVVRLDGQYVELRADQAKSLERSILPADREPGRYQAPVSLLRIFEVEFRRGIPNLDTFLAAIPADNAFHDLPAVPIAWARPELFLRYSIPDGQSRILPIEAIVFSVRTSKISMKAPITHRFKYVDAVTGDTLAELVVAEADIGSEHYYVCLVRHSCDGELCSLGGAFFR